MTSLGAAAVIVEYSNGAARIDAAPGFENEAKITKILSDHSRGDAFKQLQSEQNESRRTFTGDNGATILLPASLKHREALANDKS